MALGTPVAAAAAYSAASGTTVAPAYPSGILTTDAVLLFVGQKPTAVGGGTVTTPSGWTLRDELTNAGGYTAQGADTGNTNLRVYSWNSPVAGQTGSLTVTIGGNDVSWAFMVRIPKGAGAAEFGSADGQRTTTPTSPMSIALTNGASATDFKTGDRAIWAMCIPTDVTTPSQFSAQSITATGATFGTAAELNEPDSTTGNDIGGYSAWAAVTAGSSTTAPTVTATLAGTLTNVRGPVVLLRVREAAVTHATTGTLSGQIGSVAGSADRSSSTVTHDTSGTLAGQGSTVAGAAERTRQHATTGALTGPGSTVAGSSARFRAFATSGTLTGQLGSVVGAASNFTPHATSGALVGPGTSVTGAATNFRAFATSGTLTGQGSTVAGSADRQALVVNHATSGALSGQGSALSGSATHLKLHTTDGVLSGNNAIIVGSANLQPFVAVTHDTSGEIVGAGAVIVGIADPFAPVEPDSERGENWIPQLKRRRKWSEEREEREQLRKAIERAVDPVEATEAKVVTVADKIAILPKGESGISIPVPPQFDSQAVARMVMQVLHEREIKAQRVREAQARQRAREVIAAWQAENERRRIKRRRDEEIMLLM